MMVEGETMRLRMHTETSPIANLCDLHVSLPFGHICIPRLSVRSFVGTYADGKGPASMVTDMLSQSAIDIE